MKCSRYTCGLDSAVYWKNHWTREPVGTTKVWDWGMWQCGIGTVGRHRGTKKIETLKYLHVNFFRDFLWLVTEADDRPRPTSYHWSIKTVVALHSTVFNFSPSLWSNYLYFNRKVFEKNIVRHAIQLKPSISFHSDKVKRWSFVPLLSSLSLHFLNWPVLKSGTKCVLVRVPNILWYIYNKYTGGV